MITLDQLKSELARSGTLTDVQVQQAEEYARKAGVPFEQALGELKLADPARVGECLAALSGLPYRPLVSVPPAAQAKQLLSPACAEHWGVFPADYDVDHRVATMAVNDPARATLMQQVFQLFLEPQSLVFTIASRTEIRKAQEAHLGVQPLRPAGGTAAIQEPPPQRRTMRQPMKLASLHARMASQPAAPAAPRQSERIRTHVPEEKARPPVPEEKPIPAAEVGRFLVSMAALMVEGILGQNTDALGEVRARVRYGQLLASRMGLAPGAVDRVVLVCWLSALAGKRHILKQLALPFNAEEFLFGDEAGKTDVPVETMILSLVQRYQELRQRDAASCRDVNTVRRNLRMAWSSSLERQDMLEAFLQLLMDEEFLAGVNRGSGRILLVDPAEASQASLSPPLTHDGYEVSVVPTAEGALDWMMRTKPDLILSDVALPQMSGLDLCRRVKGSRDTSHVPFLFLLPTQMEKRAAECLRSGADDVLIRPVNLEVLFLKIQRLMSAGGEVAHAGVSGSLEDMDFTNMIQILTANNKSLEIVLKAEGREGHVYIREGSVIHAALGDVQGEPAFFEMMQWQQGEFMTRQIAEFPAPTIETGVMGLLMKGAELGDRAAGGNGAGDEPEDEPPAASGSAG